MKKLILLMLLLLNTAVIFAQFGLSGGVSVLKGFGTPKPFVGIHVGGEIPRDDQVSFYGRLSLYAKQTEAIPSTLTLYTPDYMSSTQVQYKTSMNYVILEGGNRYYIGNGYDSGFGAYGGGTFMLILNSVKRNYDDFDEVKFPLPVTEVRKGSIFNLAVGLGGGVKHTLAGVGTFYFDVSLAYMILGTASNTTASSVADGVGQDLYSPLIFTFGLGFRKDIY